MTVGNSVQRSPLGSMRSLNRQRRVRSVEELHRMVSTATSSMQSIPDVSRSSAQSTSPVGDFPLQLPSQNLLQRAAWFLSGNSEDQDKPRVLLNMSRTIQRTGSTLRKTRLYHLFFLLIVPLYTVIGAFVFQMLDGAHDDRLLVEYQNRCSLDRQNSLHKLRSLCHSPGDDCFILMKNYLDEVESCYRRWHAENRTVTHSMNDFTNALVYAFSVYTTIGYGNMAADTLQCRMATIIYGALGIPLFFAFVKEAGNLFRHAFISMYNRLNRLYDQKCRCKKKSIVLGSPGRSCLVSKDARSLENGGASHGPVILINEEESKRARFARKYSASSLFGTSGKLMDEQRRVFVAGVFVFILYILLVSLLFSFTTEFDYITSVYFLFNSVALIGFGDVFPTDPGIILLNAVFIVLGVILFSMCYFILQEEIRTQALEASRKARKSISKYSHSLIQHSRAWSRRNSPLLEGSSPETAFDRLKKRRQSAPAVSLTVPSRFGRG